MVTVKSICKAQFWPVIELAEICLTNNNYSKAKGNL